MNKLIYFDNSATTFPKPKKVYDELLKCVRKYCGNPGRSSHKLSLLAGEAIYSAREAVASLLNLDKTENVIFTQNATYALNIALKSFIPRDSHVIISDIEHNSVIRPLQWLQRNKGISISVFSVTGDVAKSIESLITPATSAIVSSLKSNVTGEEIPLSLLSQIANKKGLILIVDASQYIGHKQIDLKNTPVSILCAPGHKALFGIQGCGFLAFTKPLTGDTFIEGGSGTNSKDPTMPIFLPERYEAGTLPTPAIVSLNYGIRFVSDYGIDNIEARLNKLTNLCCDGLKSVNGVKIYGANSGVIALEMKDIPSEALASRLDEYNICIRGGLHCAPLVHKRLGTEKRGLARVSFSIFNKEKEIEQFCDKLNKISKSL
jgi:cysteine desulfurase family protein